MNWFKNLKTAQKILTLVGLVSAFILLVGMIGFSYLQKSNQSLESMYNEDLLSMKWLNENRTHIRANEANLLWLLSSKDASKRQAVLQDIQVRADKFNDNISKFEKLKLSAEETDNLSKLKIYLNQYVNVRARVIDLSEQGRFTEGQKYFVDNLGSFNNATTYLVKLGEICEKDAQAKYKENQDAANFATGVIIITILASLTLAIVVGLTIAKLISEPIKLILANVEEVANGNLTNKDIEIKTTDEIGDLCLSFNKMSQNLRNLVKQVAQSVQDISAGAEEMSAASTQTAEGAQQVSSSVAELAASSSEVSTNIAQLSEGTQQAASSITQLAAGIQEISRSVEHGANNVSTINKAIQNVSNESVVVARLENETESNANAGKEHVKKAVNKIDSIRVVTTEISDTINELGKLSSEIETIVDLIKSIAGQTNLLALNAAIEAARAGEHGKGFAVVADEVKKLAGQSGEATDKITSMIKEIQYKTNLAVTSMDRGINEVQEGVIVVNEAGDALENIIGEVKQANIKIQDMTREIDNIARGSEELVNMIQDISSITEETAASAEEIASITEQTASSAEEIASTIEESAANTEEISSITEEQTASVEEINASSQSLAKIAENLQKQVAVFRF